MSTTEDIEINQDSPNEHTLFVPAREEVATFPYEGNHIKEKVFALIGAFAVTGLVAMSTLAYWQPKEKDSVIAVVPKIIESIPMPPETENPFYTVSIGAKAAVVYDIRRDTILYGLRETEQFPLASLTKLMTALIAVESLDEKKNIAISPYAIETEGDSGLLANESWNIGDLISFTMLTSSNDGADALATAVGTMLQVTTEEVVPEYKKVDTFVDRMNSRAKELGLKNTTYSNATGLDVGARGGGVGTAEDISRLISYIWENEPQAIAHTNEFKRDFISEDGFLHHAENTNEYVNIFPGLQGSKTGYTELAGGNLAIVFDAGLDHPIAVVVLGSTLDGRFKDVDTLVNATYEYVSSGWYNYDLVAGSTPTTN